MPIRRSRQLSRRFPVDERLQAFMRQQRSEVRDRRRRDDVDMIVRSVLTERRDELEEEAARRESRAQALLAMDNSLYGRIMRAPSNRPAAAVSASQTAVPRPFRRYSSSDIGRSVRRVRYH